MSVKHQLLVARIRFVLPIIIATLVNVKKAIMVILSLAVEEEYFASLMKTVRAVNFVTRINFVESLVNQPETVTLTKDVNLAVARLFVEITMNVQKDIVAQMENVYLLLKIAVNLTMNAMIISLVDRLQKGIQNVPTFVKVYFVEEMRFAKLETIHLFVSVWKISLEIL